VSARILHVSDLHVGAREELSAASGLALLVERLAPELVVASGDLTHQGTRAQHETAAGVLKGLGVPILSVPGNHDIPHTFPARFTRPWAEFERCWETTTPIYSSDTLQVVGLNSVRPWRHQSGGLAGAALAQAAVELGRGAPGALRVAVLHHQLLGAPWRSRKRPVARRAAVLSVLADAGADLIVSGHIHQAAAAARSEFEVAVDSGRDVTVTVAPGLGQPRPRRRGEARGLMAYGADEGELQVETYLWDGAGWSVAARRFFRRAY
jgi:3',5'-cyclic AMP phosphodiesterase CpdA